MIKAVEAEPRPDFHIWVEFSDGVSGEVDLSDVAGRGVFAAWNEPGFFEKVHVSGHRSIAWNEDLEICPDAAYMEITGKTFEELTAHMEPVSLDG